MAEAIDILGQTFGLLAVTEKVGSCPNGQGVLWRCTCQCGAEVVRAASYLRNHEKKGIKAACPDCAHGANSTASTQKKLRWVWKQLRQRCFNPNNAQFDDYGGRGISVCARWSHFAEFFTDMASSYEGGMTIDRIDNNKDYSPENCRWVSRQTQNRNRRDNNFLDTPKGRMTVTDAAKAFGINEKTLRTRVNRGWPTRRCLIPPTTSKRYKKD
jgi:hypothetical protein